MSNITDASKIDVPKDLPEVLNPIDTLEIDPVLMSEVMDFVYQQGGNLNKSKISIENLILRHSILQLLISRGLTTEQALNYINQIDSSIDSYKRAIDSVAGES